MLILNKEILYFFFLHKKLSFLIKNEEENILFFRDFIKEFFIFGIFTATINVLLDDVKLFNGSNLNIFIIEIEGWQATDSMES
jgi:hypothetical protein